MLFLRSGINQNIIDEHHNKLVEILHEDLIDEVHEIGRGISQSKGHHGVLVMTIPTPECVLWNIRFSDLQLKITRSKINLAENSCSIHLVKQIFNHWEWVFVFNSGIIQPAVIHTETCGTVSLIHKH